MYTGGTLQSLDCTEVKSNPTVVALLLLSLGINETLYLSCLDAITKTLHVLTDKDKIRYYFFSVMDTTLMTSQGEAIPTACCCTRNNTTTYFCLCGMIIRRSALPVAFSVTTMKHAYKKILLSLIAVTLAATRRIDALASRPRCSNTHIAAGRYPMSQQQSITMVPCKRQSQTLHASKSPENSDEKNRLYTLLETGRDQKPNRGNFFYNDEVSSHLYGYIYLVGFFAAQDPIFLGSFLLYSGLAAWATQEDWLPANPRVPAVIAAITFATTIVCRFGFGWELPLQDVLGEVYQGPTEHALPFEFGITILNIFWGLFGSWQTKEQRDGATYGF